MQVALAVGETSKALELDNWIRQATSAHDREDHFYGLWHKVTTVRLLLRTHRAADAADLALSALPRIRKMADRNLLARMTMLAAEGLAGSGRAAEGATLLADTFRDIPDPPLDLLAEASRVAGRLAGRHLPAAFGHYARAARILARIGNVTARHELVTNARETLGHHTPSDTAAQDAALAGLADPPPPGPLASRAPAFADTRPQAARVVESAAALFHLAGYPSLIGQELLMLLHETGAVEAAALLEQDDRNTRALVWTGCAAEDAARLATAAEGVAIPLGDERGRHYLVAARPVADTHARSTVTAVHHLAASALALTDARRQERERAALWPEDPPEQQLGFIVASAVMTDLIKTMRRLAAGTVPVLITGETGTGKELLARALHDTSPRRGRPFVPFNCTAVPRDMIDSQLFGYRRGAFTGAQDAFPGVIRAASGGTLLLDEIGEIGLDVQPKLLRFLESGEVHPLGEPAPLPVDVRVLAATNRPMEDLIADGRFREDLYYRLNVVRLEIPPLRDRREEIPLLAQHYLDRWGREAGKPGLRLAEETMEYLVLYRWPGNVRELANEVRRLVALAEDEAVLMPEHLSPSLRASRRTVPASERTLDPTELVVRTDQPLAAAIEHLERTMVEQALRVHGHRVEDAARHLGLSRKGLYLKRQRLGLD
jgi:DNA-binding NtrC family response regulator